MLSANWSCKLKAAGVWKVLFIRGLNLLSPRAGWAKYYTKRLVKYCYLWLDKPSPSHRCFRFKDEFTVSWWTYIRVQQELCWSNGKQHFPKEKFDPHVAFSHFSNCFFPKQQYQYHLETSHYWSSISASFYSLLAFHILNFDDRLSIIWGPFFMSKYSYFFRHDNRFWRHNLLARVSIISRYCDKPLVALETWNKLFSLFSNLKFYKREVWLLIEPLVSDGCIKEIHFFFRYFYFF